MEIQELMESAVDSFKMCLAPRTTAVPERAEAEHSAEEGVEDAPEPVGVTPGSSREESEMKLCPAPRIGTAFVHMLLGIGIIGCDWHVL